MSCVIPPKYDLFEYSNKGFSILKLLLLLYTFIYDASVVVWHVRESMWRPEDNFVHSVETQVIMLTWQTPLCIEPPLQTMQ